MKKFLSVLLALAVAFTFTFGSSMSAFAADPTYYSISDIETAVYNQAATDVSAFESVKGAFLTGYDDAKVTTGTVTLSKASIETIMDDVTADVSNALNASAATQKELASARVEGNYYYTEVSTNSEDDYDAGKYYVNTTGTYVLASGGYDESATYYTRSDKGFTKADKEAYEAAVHNTYVTNYNTAARINSLITADVTDARIVAGESKYAKEALAKEYEVQKAEVAAKIATIVPADYTDTVPADADNTSKYYIDNNDAIWGTAIDAAGYYSFRAQVEAIVKYYNDLLDDCDTSAVTPVANDYKTALTKTVTAISADVRNEDAWLASIEAMINAQGIPTAKEEGYAAEDLATAQELAVQRLNAVAAQVKAAEKAEYQATIRDLERKATLTAAEKESLEAAKTALANLDANYAAVVEVETYKINAETNINTINAKSWSSSDFEIADQELAVAKSEKVKELNADAAKKKAETALDGAPLYDATAIDKALETAIGAVYNASSKAAVAEIVLSATPLTDVVKARMATVLGTSTNIEISQKIYKGVGAWERTATSTNYDEEKLVEVKDAIEAAKTAIRAAKTVDEVNAAFVDGVTKIDAVLTLADRDAAQAKADYTTQLGKYTTEITILVDNAIARDANYLANRGIANKQTLINNIIGTTANDKGLCAAYSVAEMTELYNKAVETLGGLKTKAEKTAEANAINTAIAAVKLPVTLADAETVLGLVDRVNALYDETVLTGESFNSYNVRTTTLTSLLKSVAALEKTAIDEAAAEIAKGGVTLDEEDAVNALIDRAKAYDENYNTKLAGVEISVADLASATETVLDTDFVTLHIAAVVDMINKIDPKADPLDVAAIKAAREAYDALGEAGASIDPNAYSKLLSLETLAAEVDQYTDVNAKADLLDMSRKLTIWRTSKTSIKVTAVGSVKNIKDNGYTVQYKFYKKAPGATSYKLVKTTSSNKYTYTNLKKGTNKFQVKVVVKDADGKIVATKMTYYRAAKVK